MQGFTYTMQVISVLVLLFFLLSEKTTNFSTRRFGTLLTNSKIVYINKPFKDVLS